MAMNEFRGIRDIEKLVADSKKLMSIHGIADMLKQEAKILEGFIRDEINSYLRSYQPKVYKRTGDMLRSIRVSEPQTDGNVVLVRIYFDDKFAYHPSVIGEDQPDGYVPWLLNVGWDIRDKVGFDAPMFTHHAGIRYIEKAIKKYNSRKSGVNIIVTSSAGRYL